MSDAESDTTVARREIDRRRVLQALVAGGAGVAVAGPLRPVAAQAPPTAADVPLDGPSHTPGVGGDGPYGPLGDPDANGLRLPEGFTARVVAISGEVVAGSDYEWHAAPDGGACFAADDGGWVYVSNSETGPGDGGVGALRFDGDGNVTDAYRILSGTARNCSGGATPWGTWLSCEEYDNQGDADVAATSGAWAGRVWECDPFREGQGTVRPALGVFSHEAVAVDPDDEKLYLTEDVGDSRLYRFTSDAWPSLEAGTLEALVLADDGSVTWVEVPDPSAAEERVRLQVPEATQFPGGEGIWHRDGHIVFTTKGDDHVWDLDVAAQRLSIVYDGADTAPLHGVDNVISTPNAAADWYVVEDGDDLQVMLLSAEGGVHPFAQQTGHDGSEMTGPAFAPDGTRFYVSSQRGAPGGPGIGITYEITGPFRTADTTTTTTTAPTAASTTTAESPTTGGNGAGGGNQGDADDDGDGSGALVVGAVVGGAAVIGGAVMALRRRGPNGAA